jgi:diguanylate cyclase (GGDEF)-like protein
MTNKEEDPFENTVVDPVKKKGKKDGGKATSKFHVVLTVMVGKESDFGKNLISPKEKITIGRDKKCDFVLTDERVSKVHCELNLMVTDEFEQIILKDLDSTNGTYVNGASIKQKILMPGDKIELGETVLRFNYHDEIEEKYHSKLFNFASKDSLTGMYNKRYVMNELQKHINMAKRNNRIFSLVMIDIDNFKKINDTYGHVTGDEFLKKVAFTIDLNLRQQDVSGRFGGEEFLIILPETTIEGAFNLAKRIRKKIADTEILHKGKTIKGTISIGVSQFDIKSPDLKTLLKSADNALYMAKQAGKNKVVKVNVKE